MRNVLHKANHFSFPWFLYEEVFVRSNSLKWLRYCCFSGLLGCTLVFALPPQTAATYTWLGTYSFGDGADVNTYWKCLWLGYGTGKVSSGQLWLQPAVSTSNSTTHSALVASRFTLPPSTWDISVEVTTDAQLRTQKVRRKAVPSPNAWEVAWLIADMADDGSAGLYFMLKTNGVELGAYADGGARYIYLFTSPTPTLVPGRTYVYRLVNDGQSVTALVGRQPVASSPVAPLAGWPLGTRIGLYTEDAAVHFGPVTVAGN